MLTECLQLFNFDLYKWFEGYRITLWVTFWWNIEYFSFFSPHVGWVGCWFPPLVLEFFLWILQFSPLLKNQDFQIQFDQESGRWRTTTSGRATSKSSFILLNKKDILREESPASNLSVVITSLLSSKLSDFLLLPQLESLCSQARLGWVAYFWVEIKYLSISLLLTCQTGISDGGGWGGGGWIKKKTCTISLS